MHRRDLKKSEKEGYIAAVQCFRSARAKDLSLPDKFTRHDEFTLVHSAVAEYIHGVVC